MKSWWNDWKEFWKNRWYVTALSLTAVFSYGFMITHQTIGIDDTPFSAYFEEGLAAIVGRWVLFLLNKVVHIAEFAPFLTDLAGVLILMAGVTVWCVLLRRILGTRLPMYGYTLFACLFLSNPLISEVYTYYLHNGIAIGYLACGIALCCFWEGLAGGRGGLLARRAALCFGCSCLALWIAIGCYESFMVVFLVGVCIVLCSARMRAEGTEEKRNGTKGQTKKTARKVRGAISGVLSALAAAAVIAAAALALRSLMVAGVTAVFGLEPLKEEAVQRSLSEMAGWLTREGAGSRLAMVVKRILLMYGVFGYAYYPIAVYVAACAAVLVCCIWRAVRNRDGWIVVLMAASFIASYLLVLVEGKATLYRAAQFLPLFSAWGFLLLLDLAQELTECLRKPSGLKARRVVNGVVALAVTVVLWNQCTEMNKWFYVDYLKYEDAKETMNQIAYELEKGFDTNKPVIFTGTYKLPETILENTYVPFNSEVFYKMNRLAGLLDPHILEKFYREQGVWIAQTPSLSVLEWGKFAFDSGEELARFFAMHGHRLTAEKNPELYPQAEEASLGLPSFPEEGSIADMGDYIVVHF